MFSRLIRHRLVKDTAIMMGVQVSGYVLPLLTLPYLTRVLGPANLGLTVLGTALVLYFAVVVEYGFAVTGTRRIAIVREDPDQVARVYSSIMACKILLLVLCLAILWILLAAIPRLREHASLYLLSYLQVLGWGLSPNWLLQGMQRMKLIAASDYGGKVICVALIFVLVRTKSDYLMATALQSGGFLLSAIIGLVLSFSVVGMRLRWPDLGEMKTAMSEGLPVFLSMASMNVMTSSNIVILRAMTTDEQVGLFAVASRLIIAARALTNPIATAVYPHMSKLAAQSPSKALQFLRRQLLWTAAPFLGITLGMLFFGPLAVRILSGPAYQESGVLLQIMSMTPFIHAVSMCFGTYYMLAFGYEKAWSKIIIGMMLLNFLVLGATLLVLRPARAVALTTSLMDLYAAGSCILFYLRTSGKLEAVPPVGPMEPLA